MIQVKEKEYLALYERSTGKAIQPVYEGSKESKITRHLGG
jgi:hypothetical protein